MQIFVKTLRAKHLPLTVVLSDKTEDVKRKVRRESVPTKSFTGRPTRFLPSPGLRKVFEMEEVPPDQQRLTFAGQQLSDGHSLV